MLIAIPTKGRADRQITFKHFSKWNNVVLCPPQSEKESYKWYGERVKCVPNTCEGIAETRKWILTKLSRKLNQRYVLMLDDDMDFCYRPSMEYATLKTIKSQRQLHSMIGQLQRWLNAGIIHVGISARQGNNHVSKPYVDVGRMMNAYAYDVEALLAIRPKIEFGRIPVMEDFDLTLQLLRAGFPNRVSYKYCWNQRGSNATGGCSTYRTAQVQTDAAFLLKTFHPDYVSIVTKKGWKNLEDRTDVRIQWRKAYEDRKDTTRSK